MVLVPQITTFYELFCLFWGKTRKSGNLQIGITVIADSVNAIQITCDAWRKVATDSDSAYLEVEKFAIVTMNRGIEIT